MNNPIRVGDIFQKWINPIRGEWWHRGAFFLNPQHLAIFFPPPTFLGLFFPIPTIFCPIFHLSTFFLAFFLLFLPGHPEAWSVLIAGSFHVAMQIQHRVDLATQSAKGAWWVSFVANIPGHRSYAQRAKRSCGRCWQQHSVPWHSCMFLQRQRWC